jgi:hypothetical protein
MHPLLVHFPIVLVILYALGSLIPTPKNADQHPIPHPVNDLLLLLTALTSVLTALMGLFLSKEEGYDPDALLWHKWGGIILSVFTLAWYYFKRHLSSVRWLPYFTSLIALGIILITGHQGAAITHGQNFLFAPVTPEKNKPLVPFEEALVFADMVKPVIDDKCMSCHNSTKAKGELVMESEELLLKGGKSGKLWDSTAADFGLMLRRVHLPLEQKKHMPPHGKPQLTDEELSIITHWIKKGSDFTLKVADLPTEDTLRMIANRIFMDAETAPYDFEEADPGTIERLNTSNRIVMQESLNSPAVTVSFFNSKLFKVEQLKELNVIKNQVVSLDLSKMPVKDADLNLLSEFVNLRRLHLNFTDITGETLKVLEKLKYLRTLSVSGTRLKSSDLEYLNNFPQLKNVFAWNIPVDSTRLERIRDRAKNIRFETGFRADTITLKLSPPILQNEAQIITTAVPLKLKHYLSGVSIHYTTDSTEPDSLRSNVFKPGAMISNNTFIRAKAFKPGWIGSDMTEALFFRHTHIPDTILILTTPDSNYRGSSKLLYDLDKGTTNFRAGNWIGWRKNRMELMLVYKKPVVAQSVTLSTVIHISQYILPPVNVEIWGGDEESNLKLLGRIVPVQPGPMSKDSVNKAPGYLKGYECHFQPTTIKYLKVIGTNVAKLPRWHPGKGAGYIFVDEILVN